MIRTIRFYLYIAGVIFRWLFMCSMGLHNWRKAKHFDGFWCKACYAKGEARYYRVQEIVEVEQGDNLSTILSTLKSYL